MSNAITEIDNTDLVFIFGYNPADSHPIVANHVINAKRNGAKIIVCDPRKSKPRALPICILPEKRLQHRAAQRHRPRHYRRGSLR
jgi:predicted molibdopterin-dependent oxidoreductase YjgC